MHVCMVAWLHGCMYACMHVCMYACMHVCLHACIFCVMHVRMYIHTVVYSAHGNMGAVCSWCLARGGPDAGHGLRAADPQDPRARAQEEALEQKEITAWKLTLTSRRKNFQSRDVWGPGDFGS